jgi:hypothetical protein
LIQSLRIIYFLLLQSFLLNRHFFVRFCAAQLPLSRKAVFFGRSSISYTPRTFQPPRQQPQQPLLMTAILESDSDPATASLTLHNHLNTIQTWLHKRPNPNLAPQGAHAGQRTQISPSYVHNTYRNVPSCPHEQRATSLCGSSQVPRTPPGQKTHSAPPYLH